MMDPMMDPQLYQMMSLMGGGNGVLPGRRAMGFGAAQRPGGMPFMHNMNFLRMGPHGMHGTPHGAGRYPFPRGMGGNPFANMGGPLGMAGGGMGMGMGGGFGGGEDLGLANRGAGNAMGMGMGMGMGGAMSPPWWDMMMGLEEEEEDDDEAFWEEEGEMPEVFTSYLKGLRGRRKSHGFGGGMGEFGIGGDLGIGNFGMGGFAQGGMGVGRRHVGSMGCGGGGGMPRGVGGFGNTMQGGYGGRRGAMMPGRCFAM